LADALKGVGAIALTEAPADIRALLDGRRPIVVVRDAHRHAWERRAVEALLAAAPDAIVVEVGVPVWRPDCKSYIATHGAGHASFAAAAEQLQPGCNG
jgi:beta-N-acetylhexosaminidase